MTNWSQVALNELSQLGRAKIGVSADNCGVRSFQPGDLTMVATARPERILRGDVVMFRSPEGFRFGRMHRMRRSASEMVLEICDEAASRRIELKPSMLVGRVVDAWRGPYRLAVTERSLSL